MMAAHNNFVYSLIILCVFVGVLDSTQTNKRIEIKALQPHHTADECRITPLLQSSVGSTARCNKFVGRYVDGPFVKNLTVCHITKNETVLQYQCVEGSWKLTTGTDFHLRSRRFPWGALFGLLTAAVKLVTVVYCTEKYGNVECKETEVEPKDLVAPTYTTCPPADIQSLYTASRKQKTVQVTWTDPTATDDEELISNEQTCCQNKKGEEFQGLPGAGLPHSITYTAKDNYRLSATCNFNFVVTYLSCNEPDIPTNGRKVSCPDGYIYGGECTFECYTGYEMVGSDTATCQQDETWDNTPICQKVVCDAPFELTNGKVACDDPSYPFDDDCMFTCDDGFKLTGSTKMTCKADKTWSVDASQVSCIDDDSPVIECTTTQVFYADRGSFYTSVTWDVPTATDNVDPNPSIIQISGPSQGQVLSEGFHSVEYKATDSEGNSHPALSECTIVIEVKVIRCSTGPTDALDEPRFMTYNCSDTSFYNGVACYLDCELNLPLNGTDYMTCEYDGSTDKGVWNWGTGHQPVCEVVECPALDPPGNGAFTTDSVNARPLHVMFCQNGYDISSVGSEFHGRLSCQDSGEWYPLDAFPDCIVSILPWLNLPAELYYEGNCNDEATKNEIKQKVLEYLAGVQADVDKSICPDVNTCKVENVVVVCGEISGRKRRSSGKHIIHKRNTDYASVTFDIKVLFEQGNKTTQDAYIGLLDVLNAIKDLIQEDVNNGELNVYTDLTLSQSDGFVTADNPNLLCDSGYKVDTGSSSCKPCPPGTYLDSGTGNCEYCGIGEYMDHAGAIECNACPESHSTLSTGSKDISKCIKLCSPGFFSSSTMEPCSACEVGNYQPQEGQIECMACPSGTATNKTGSTSADYCDYFDISVDTLPQRTDIGSFSTDEITVISASVWLKLCNNENSDLSIFIADSAGDIIHLNFSNTISIQAGTSNAIQTSNTLSWKHWTHIISTVDIASGTLKLYVDETLVVDETGVSVTPRPVTAGSIHILSGLKGMYISGLVLYGRHLSNVDMTSLSQTCAVTSNDEIFSMTNVLPNIVEGIVVITPTTCDPVDECASEPCGDHTCINMVNEFQCICHGGMTGELCTVHPDYCLGNACVNGTCVPENGTYTCSCNNGYSGAFCDTPPVNGGWSQWVEWSGCDVTCDGGTGLETEIATILLPFYG
ncbi:sushi, von Willebrand factor type A, EGF and pentraxin domain-containing protein 1-like isoform X1 [Mercenaria mercenaria]|uniref:sushi, von Willebrand factor type A, EGF and pentraxin domain-containing protein 1-like isoform X1 n=1 Tax=Mercenaria mercenaria TaxID=6596 RepID=UPI00234F1DD4|nr:sushi, von Willebrand factor type A, EGF and pentraxin domain-containing protein 1-like isoform X1 [Mercenaria mercenaria]